MKKGLTAIAVVLDSSGSMYPLIEDTVGGFNQFLTDQKAQDGDAEMTLTVFGGSITMGGPLTPIKKFKKLTKALYKPRGSTPLLDAIGQTMRTVGFELNLRPESERPEHVIFVVITDGEENSSVEFTNEKIKEMIQHQTDVYKWDFVYLGANVDAFTEAGKLGINIANAAQYGGNRIGTQSAYQVMTNSVSRTRTGGTAALTEEEKASLKKTI